MVLTIHELPSVALFGTSRCTEFRSTRCEVPVERLATRYPSFRKQYPREVNILYRTLHVGVILLIDLDGNLVEKFMS